MWLQAKTRAERNPQAFDSDPEFPLEGPTALCATIGGVLSKTSLITIRAACIRILPFQAQFGPSRGHV